MWRGILAGYQDVQARKDAKTEREEAVRLRKEEREEDFTFRREESEANRQAQRDQYERELLERRRELAFQFGMEYGGSPRGGAAGDSGEDSIEHYAQVLKTSFGLSDEAIQEVAVAGTQGLSSLVDTLTSQRASFQEQGLEFPQSQVASIVDTMVITPSRQEPFDFTMIEEYVGEALDPLQREMLQRNQITPGSTYIPPATFVQPPEIKEINELEERALNDVTQRASIESRNLNSALNQIRAAEENTRDPERLARVQAAKNWVLGRQLQISEAQKSAEGGNPYGLVDLYGNEFFQRMFESQPRFEGAILSPVFEEIKPAAPKRANSMEELAILKQLGLVSEGDVWQVYNPQTQSFNEIQISGE